MSQSSYGQERRIDEGGERASSSRRGRLSQQGDGRGHERGRVQSRGFRTGPSSGPVIYNQNISTALDTRLTDGTQDSLIVSFNQLRVCKPNAERPLRPDYGIRSKPVTLRANFFAVKLPKQPLFDYSIEIQPEIKGREKKYLSHIAHDQSERLVAAKKLPTPLVFTVTFREDGQARASSDATAYTITIQSRDPEVLNPVDMSKYLAGDYSMRNDQEQGGRIIPLISALNIVLQSHASKTGIRVGGDSEKGRNRYFFPDPHSAEKLPLNLGVAAVRGYFASVRPTLTQLMVNVNACMTPFFESGNLGDILSHSSKRSYGALPTLPDHFLRAKITTTYLGYKKKLRMYGVGDKSARRATFERDDVKISVEDFFKQEYGITLKCPDELPVINIGNNRWIPAELCEIEAQPYQGKLTNDEVRKILQYATHPPRGTAELIIGRGLPTLNLTSKSAFGIEIGREMTNVPARILPAPKVTYGKKSVDVKAATASWNVLKSKFQKAAVVQSWWVMIVNDGQPVFTGANEAQLESLVTGFQQKLGATGISVPTAKPLRLFVNLPCPDLRDPSRERAVDIIRTKLKESICSGSKPSFVLVLLSRVDPCIYLGIKRIGDVELGFHTVHMLLSGPDKAPALNMSKRDQYFSNIALKVNTKLGGLNHTLDENSMRWLNKKKTMVVGIDVTHPSPDSLLDAPSIAAVVANSDSTFSQYPASLRLQGSRKEMVQSLGEMMIERLQVYKKKNGNLPDRVIVFRDGVSEGQFDILIADEIPQVIKSFGKLKSGPKGKAYRPILSYIVCGKRHHARFFATDEAHADQKGNTLPGTVVDRGVTAVFDFDFYLQAHAGLQGTAKSTHYTVVYDEMGFGADEIQQGINNSCYIYGRATKAVSLVPAAYYADLACERARFYLNELMNLSGKKSRPTRFRTEEEKKAEKERVFAQAQKKWGEGLHQDIRDNMFYL